MKVLKLIALIFLVAAAAIVAAAMIYGRRAPALPADSSAFVFKKGMLWASVDGRAAALIDSGTSRSVFPKDWSTLGEAEGSQRISTPLGESRLPVRRMRPSKIGGIAFEGSVFAGDVPYPIIGNDFIFSKGNVLFSRTGLEFDVSYAPEDAIACVPLVIGYSGNTTSSPVESIHLLLEIDGAQQKVYFDTGMAAALMATASAPQSATKLFPRMDLQHNSFGKWALAAYFYREASLSLGDRSKSLPYRHYYTDNSWGVPFVMGAGILKEYSIVFEPRKGRACFYEPR